MKIPAFRWLLLAGLLLNSSLSEAQPRATEGTEVPDSAAPAAFQLQYFSVFNTYQFFREQPLLSWQETNDHAGKIGGWRFYAREAAQPENGASAKDAGPDTQEKERSGQTQTSHQHAAHGGKP